MKKILLFSAIAFAFSLFVSCGNSRKMVKKESTSRVNKKRIPKVKGGKTKPSELKKGLPNSNITNPQLYDFIEKWRGAPHRMGGMSTKGVDCSGLVIQIYKEVYNQEFTNRRARDLYTETRPLRREELKEGDLVFFKIRSRNIDHIGLYLANGDFVHVSSRKGVMISNLEETYFKKYYFSGGRKKS